MSSTIKSIRNALSDPTSSLIIGLIFITGFLTIIIFILPPYSTDLNFNQQVNVYLTYMIAIFAFVEAFSTWSRYIQSKRRFQIEDLWKALERVYGPLFSILSQKRRRPEITDKGTVETSLPITGTEKDELDKIFEKYPFMFPPDILNYWKEKIQNPDPFNTIFLVSLDFTDMLSQEYSRIVAQYNSLVGKT